MNSFMCLEILVVVLPLLYGYIFCKECTNTPTELSSHTLRYELLSSNNETWKQEMFSHYHLIHTDDSEWMNLIPRKILMEEGEFSWMMMYRKIKNSVGPKGPGVFLDEVSLHDVRLDPNSMYGEAQQTNLEYLLMLDVDNLVWSFRKTAGLPTPGKAYGGWEDPNTELRGHFVGHYMSASAHLWASTHNDTLKDKMSAVVSALSACQNKMGTGYLSAFPSELFDRFEAIKPVWAPYYTIHKILAGLLDQYIFADNTQALKMATWMADYFYTRVQNVISKYTIQRHWQSLNEETGGMNDVLYRLYSITGDQKQLLLAHLFDKPCFLGLLAVKADDISGFHANTHIPIVIGSQMRYEVTGDSLYKEIATFFMDVVNSSHSYATGGTSVSEFWSDPKRLANTLQTENEESCTTYNMLKVSRNLFRWTNEMAYADYYERALTNGVLGIQRGKEPGVMIYMLPQGRGASKARSYHGWGTKFNSFWCCYGTGIESFSKLGDSIYFEEDGKVPGLYIIQYISSSLDWKSGQILIDQKVEPVVSWDPRLQVTLTVSSVKGGADLSSTLNLRIPFWTYSTGAKATVNSQDLLLPNPGADSIFSLPLDNDNFDRRIEFHDFLIRGAGNFLSVTRKWSPGDKISLELPISLRTEVIQDDRPEYASVQAILYGPYLLVGLTNGDWDIKTESAKSFSDWITPVPAAYNSHLISLFQESGNSTFVVTNSNESITMEKLPEPGTDSSVHATFRLIIKDSKFSDSKFSEPKDVIGKSVMLEPFDLPGMLMVHKGTDEELGVADEEIGSTFRLVAGLDGKNGTVSLESESLKDCYVYSGVNYKPGGRIKLSCNVNDEFKQATSFILRDGISQYHPISFVAKGATRNFLLAPLLSLIDESYTVYFNIQS